MFGILETDFGVSVAGNEPKLTGAAPNLCCGEEKSQKVCG